jgi:integrase
MRVLTADETRTFLEGAADDEMGPLYAVAALTGLRQGELLGLGLADLGDLDGTRPTLTVRRALARVTGGWALAEPKTDRSRRTLELGPTVARALRRQRARQELARRVAGDLWQNRDGLVFTDELGRALTGTEVTRAFSTALARLGLPHVRFHDLRHGAASMMLAQGVPLKLVSEQLGHSTITITADVYAHVSREQRRDAADAIERAIGGEG